jgi:polyhydroxyalkanoate synthesis regulator phasin
MAGHDADERDGEMQLDDVRKTIEATISNLTPSRAQDLAKNLLDPGAAKEQVAKTAADLLEWSQRSRERLRDLVRREIQEQVRGVGVATQTELDALRKRVRELERAAGMTASGRKKATASKARATSTATRKKTSRGTSGSSGTRSTARTAPKPRS